MIKIHETVYYFGEFGYFNFIILGNLEEYLLKNNCMLKIKTYEDYFKILNHKFPNCFLKSDALDVSDRGTRMYHKIQNNSFNEKMVRCGYIPLEKLLKCDVIDWKDGRTKIKPIKNSLFISKKEKKYISVLCRKRSIDLDRNLCFNSWEKIIKDIKKTYPEIELVFHGLKDETLEIEGIFCSDILESISYLNNSIFFVSSMSGYAQFASNCECSILQIGPEFQMIPYNPFKKTNLQLGRNELSKTINYIKQFSS